MKIKIAELEHMLSDIRLSVYADNINAIKLYNKLDFKKHGSE